MGVTKQDPKVGSKRAGVRRGKYKKKKVNSTEAAQTANKSIGDATDVDSKSKLAIGPTTQLASQNHPGLQKSRSNQQKQRKLDLEVNYPGLQSALPADIIDEYIKEARGKLPTRLMEGTICFLEELRRAAGMPYIKLVNDSRTPAGKTANTNDRTRLDEYIAYWGLRTMIPEEIRARVGNQDGEAIGRLCKAATIYLAEFPRRGRRTVYGVPGRYTIVYED